MLSAATDMSVPMEYFFIVSTILFGLGLFGALRRNNAIMILMSIELMLNAVNINLVGFARHGGAGDPVTGQIFAIFVMAVAAAEVSVGLAILITLARRRKGIDINEIDLMKG